MANRVVWTADGSAAFLMNERGDTIGRWVRGRPDISTFDPATYTYGQGYSFQAPGQGQGYMYNAWQGGDTGGYYYPQERSYLDLEYDKMDLEYTDREKDRQQRQAQFDEEIALAERELAQDLEKVRMQIASSEGMQKYEWEQRFRQLEQEHRNAVEYLQLDWAERHKLADKELATRLREIQGQERLGAAETWARPFDYLAYNKWMAGQPAMTTEGGLPVGAPEWQTGEPAVATVGTGAVATGGADIYGQKLAAGGRIQEFGAWGGPTTPVAGTPWVSPHQANVTQFAAMPEQAQQMAYARWRQRGVTPETAQQAMYAAAPTGTAGTRVVGYG